MANLLMPGRQIVTTKFQEEYLKQLCRLPVEQLNLHGTCQGDGEGKLDKVIFAITSANQSNSRYNPLPLADRAIGVDRFMQPFYDFLDVAYDIAEIPHYQPTDKFAHHIVQHCNFQLEDEITPENTIVFSSTESIIAMFRERGYAVATGEWDPEKQTYTQKPPREILNEFMKADMDWLEDAGKDLLSESHWDFWQEVPRVPKKILRIANEPLLTEEGSITETRSYSSYSYGMAHSDVLNMKYGDIKDAIVPGRIVDEGCADGALLERVAEDFPDSDLVGIEITSEFMARFKERIRAGAFGGTFVHVYQRNLMDPIFEDNSIDSTLCNSTTHEIFSYGDGVSSLKEYINLKYDQLCPQGRLIIRDVIGPKNKDKRVAVRLNKNNGKSDDPSVHFKPDQHDEYAEYLETLSTRARFERFAREYLPQQDSSGISYEIINYENEEYAVLVYKDIVEFMTKKDYTDNWHSELHEEFAFWDINDWCQAVSESGFEVIHDSEGKCGTRVYQNDWIVENRWEDTLKLFHWDEESGVGGRHPYPPTNIVLVARKPAV
jgi:hypothetical protein